MNECEQSPLIESLVVQLEYESITNEQTRSLNIDNAVERRQLAKFVLLRTTQDADPQQIKELARALKYYIDKEPDKLEAIVQRHQDMEIFAPEDATIFFAEILELLKHM